MQLDTPIGETCPEQVLWYSSPGPSSSLGRRALVFSEELCVGGMYFFLHFALSTGFSSWGYRTLKQPSSITSAEVSPRWNQIHKPRCPSLRSRNGPHPDLPFVTHFTTLQSSLPRAMLFASASLDGTDKTPVRFHVVLTSQITFAISAQDVMWSNPSSLHFSSRTHLI